MQSQEGGIVPEEYRTEYVVDRVNTLGRAFLGVTRRVRPLPRPQVRPVSPEGLLPALRLLQQRERDRTDPVLGRPEPDGDRDGRRGAGRRSRRCARSASTRSSRRSAASGAAFDARLRRLAGARRRARRPARGPARPDRASAARPRRARPRGREEGGRSAGETEAGRDPARSRTSPLRASARSLGGDEDQRPEDGRRAGSASAQTPAWATATSAFGPKVRLLRAQPAVLAGPVGAAREAGRCGSARHPLGRPLQRQPRLRDPPAQGRHAQRRPPPRLPRQLDRDRDRPAIPPGAWHHVGAHLRRLEPRGRAAPVRRRPGGRVADDRGQPPPQHPPRPDRGRTGTTCPRAAHRPAARRDPGRRERSTSCASTTASSRRSRWRRLAASPTPLARALARPAAERSAAERAAAARALRPARPIRPRGQSASALAAARGEENDAPHRPARGDERCATCRAPRPTFVLARGAYDAPTERVEPGTPEAHPGLPEGRCPRNRLGLARWLLDADASAHGPRDRQPLLGPLLRPRPRRDARGLRQPGPPAHRTPSCSTGWPRTFVDVGLGPEGAPAAHRRSPPPIASRRSPTPGAARGDPANEWLGRGPAHRLAAEQIRDRRSPRAACSSARSAARASTPTSRPGSGRSSRRATPRATRRARATTCIAGASTPSGSARRRRRRRSLRRRRAALLHGEAPAHEHAAAGARAAERPAVRRGGAQRSPSA